MITLVILPEGVIAFRNFEYFLSRTVRRSNKCWRCGKGMLMLPDWKRHAQFSAP